jgi:hypothetical protein
VGKVESLEDYIERRKGRPPLPVFASPATEKEYDFPIMDDVVTWMRDVLEEIQDIIVGGDKPNPEKLLEWAVGWRQLNDGNVQTPENPEGSFILAKEETWEDLATLTVRCEVDVKKRSFEFSKRWSR